MWDNSTPDRRLGGTWRWYDVMKRNKPQHGLLLNYQDSYDDARLHNLPQIIPLSFTLFPSMIHEVHYAADGLLTYHLFHKLAYVTGSNVEYFLDPCNTLGGMKIHLVDSVDSL